MNVSIATRVVRSCRAEQANIDTLIVSMTHLLSSSGIEFPRKIESELVLLKAEPYLREGDVMGAKAMGVME